MDNNIEILLKQFNHIKELNWVKSLRKGSTGIGYTFECLLGKKEENFPIPDFDNVEIKVKHEYSKGYITLFNATPDGDYLFPIKSIVEKYGYPDKTFREFKVFNVSVCAQNITYVGKYKKFMIIIDYFNKKVNLMFINKYNEFIPAGVSWSFDLLKERVFLKLQTLAIVKASEKVDKENTYYKYNSISIYKLKSFDAFLQALNEGKIRITFKIGVFKSGRRFGQIHDRGTGFEINEYDISNLYFKVK